MIYLLLSLIAIPFLGMLYFMKKVKDGEITLSEKSWHFKLLKYMWDVNVESLTNMCPYYWSVVCSVIILIPYLFARYVNSFCNWLFDSGTLAYIKNKAKKVSTKKESKPLFIIPQSKKDMFSLIWNRGSEICAILLVLTCLLVGLIFALFYIYSVFTFNVIHGIILISIIIYVLVVAFSSNYWNYREIMLEPWVKFFNGLFGIVSQPFKLIWQLLLKLFNVYENLCPAINWDSKSKNK